MDPFRELQEGYLLFEQKQTRMRPQLIYLLLAAVILISLSKGEGMDVTPGSSTESCENPSMNIRPPQLMIASHNRLLILDLDTGLHRTLHTGKGVYYSVVMSDVAGRLHVSTRPESGVDEMLELDVNAPYNRLISTVLLEQSKFTHEVVRGGERIFVADTSTGAINVMSYPGFKPLRKMEKYTTL
jgi:hypothetical protein